MSDKIKVRFSVTEEVRHSGTVEMTRAEYEEWCDRIDSARGFRRQEAADDLIDLANLDRRNAFATDAEIDDFDEVTDGVQIQWRL